jgi:uroporphyrinogen-III synthase
MSAEAAGALAGRCVVITRAPEQSAELIARLQEMGAHAIALPMVQFVAADDPPELDQAICNLGQFHWLIFTSGNSVRFFARRCRALGRWPLAPTVACAAVGQATSEALEKEGVRAAFVPRDASAAGLAAEAGEKFAGRRVLLPRSSLASNDLPDALRKIGATVTTAVTYSTLPDGSAGADALRALVQKGADAILFFSPSAWRVFAGLAGSERLREIASKMGFAAIGPTTAAAIRQTGVPVAVEAPQATTDSLVAALAKYFAGQPAREERR